MSRNPVVQVAICVVILGACAASVVSSIARSRAPDELAKAVHNARADLRDALRGPYDAGGRYVMPVRQGVSPPTVVLASNGLPVVSYHGRGYQTNPVTIEQYGLTAFSKFVHRGRSDDRETALRAADWLVANQRRGRWLYHFNYGDSGWTLAAPWSSAMAQGQAMSLLERAYRLTHKGRYLRAAVAALAPLRKPVSEGGLTECFMGDCKLPFFEEYPSTPPSYVLNGFLFTLIGLYDLGKTAPASGAAQLYAAGYRTLVKALPDYDIAGRASYDLTGMTIAGREPDMASLPYQAVHVYLLRALNTITPNKTVAAYARRWARQFDATRSHR